jgi:hypothetical protein
MHLPAFSLRHAVGAVVAVLAGWTALSTASAEPLMQLSGSFTVTPSGAAAYTIPIDVPPGTAGMSPSISLNYTSQGGNGIVGVGWTLGGLPSITRCPTTIATEGAAGAVTYSSSDRFCLEGQKLIVTNGGTYGANGTQYATEVNGFSLVTSYGSTGGGPAYFKVQTKSGQTMVFGDGNGTTQGSGPTAPTGAVRVWALSKVSDTAGNYLSITYTAAPAGVTAGTNEAPYPKEIDYTGNAAQGLSAANKVTFVYAQRPAADVIDLYNAGA